MRQILSGLVSRVSREAALLRRNVRSRRGHFLAECQRTFVLRDILPKDEFDELRDLTLANRSLFLRKHSSVRQGAAVGGHELRASPCAPVVDRLVRSDFVEELRARTGIPELQYVPEADTNRLSLPVSMARHIANALPQCEATFFPGEGHFVAARHWDEIVATLIA